MLKHGIGPWILGDKYKLAPWLHPRVPTYTLAEFREAHPSGAIRCGSCGEPQSTRDGFKHMDREHGPDTLITVTLTHNHYTDDVNAADVAPDAETPTTTHVLVFEDDPCERYVSDGDHREERLFGIVYREVAAPERPYRDDWYPTGDFRAPLEVQDGEA